VTDIPNQLRFEGDPVFEPSSFAALLKEYYVDVIKEELNRPSPLLFHVEPQSVQLALMERAPDCPAHINVGEEYICCNLEVGHDGDHFDHRERFYWRVL
jgi:hypothetical protein